MSDSSLEFLEKVYSANSLNELRDGYAEWATQYDRDVMRMGYQSPGLVAGMMSRYVKPSEAPILDCGAGTGLVGLLLAGLGYRELAALDMSEDMLQLARARGCYDDVRTGVLGEPLVYADNHFAAVVASGVFTLGHAPASAYEEIARVLRPGGHFIVSERIDDDLNADYSAQRHSLVDQHVWEMAGHSEVIAPFPLEPAEAHVRHRVYVCRKC